MNLTGDLNFQCARSAVRGASLYLDGKNDARLQPLPPFSDTAITICTEDVSPLKHRCTDRLAQDFPALYVETPEGAGICNHRSIGDVIP